MCVCIIHSVKTIAQHFWDLYIQHIWDLGLDAMRCDASLLEVQSFKLNIQCSANIQLHVQKLLNLPLEIS